MKTFRELVDVVGVLLAPVAERLLCRTMDHLWFPVVRQGEWGPVQTLLCTRCGDSRDRSDA